MQDNKQFVDDFKKKYGGKDPIEVCIDMLLEKSNQTSDPKRTVVFRSDDFAAPASAGAFVLYG